VPTKLALAKRLRQIRVSRICVFLPFGGGTASAALSTVASTLAAAALEYFAALMPLRGRNLKSRQRALRKHHIERANEVRSQPCHSREEFLR
jgi:hypothetical protein